MYVVRFLAMAVQEQVAVTPAYAGNDDGRMYLWIALGVGVLALVAALMLARAVIASDTGTAEMRAISDAIREGAEAFLRRQYRTIGGIAVALARLHDPAALEPLGDGGAGRLGLRGAFAEVLARALVDHNDRD